MARLIMQELCKPLCYFKAVIHEGGYKIYLCLISSNFQIAPQSCCNSPQSHQHVQRRLSLHTSVSIWHSPASWIFWQRILASVISTLAEIRFCHCYPCPVLLWLPSALIFTSPTFYFFLTTNTFCLHCWAVCFSKLKTHAI